MSGRCVEITDCSIPRCVNGDCVVVPDENGNWRCNCFTGWVGIRCDIPIDSLTTGEAVATTEFVVSPEDIRLSVSTAFMILLAAWLWLLLGRYLLLSFYIQVLSCGTY